MTTGYRRMHEMLVREFGSAVGRPCVAPGCTRLADGWGLVGEASHYGEKGGDDKIVRWSTDPNDYAPVCYSHNAQLDRGGDWQHCPRGHYRLTWGTDTKSECRGCARDRHRARRADPAYRAREYARERENRARRTNGKKR
ncbi:hypothetical protein ACW5CM_07340 [Microbacterium sp. A588]